MWGKAYLRQMDEKYPHAYKRITHTYKRGYCLIKIKCRLIELYTHSFASPARRFTPLFLP